MATSPRRRLFGCAAIASVLVSLVSFSPVISGSAATPSGWNIVTSPNTDPSQSNLFMNTTCTNAWNCWAVGGVIPSLGGNSQPNALIDSWNGSTWSIVSASGPPGTDASLLWSVTCVVASDCWAVGAQEQTGSQNPQTLAEHWDGSTWSVVPTPAVAGYLFSVTCSASADCWAVGDSVDSQGNPLNGIIEHWDGSQWSSVASPSSGQTYDQLSSVTCTTASDCWAVGAAGPNQIQYNFLPGIVPTMVGGGALIEHWDGNAWSVTNGSPPGSGQYLQSVTCTGNTNCWTVGSTMDSNGNPFTSLVEHWDGSTWTPTTALDPTTPANILTSVTCLTSSQCWATGTTNSASGQNETPTPYIENWNGTGWSVQPSPNVIAFGYLGGISCVRNSGCYATGFSANSLNNNTTLQTLIEQLVIPPSESQGLWMTASDGGVFSFGMAAFYGSTGGMKLNKPVVGMAATPDGGGYWLVASDGGVFAFGNAQFHGSTGGMALNKPIVGMAATPHGGGYWLVASDGGVFAFGDAQFHGSTGGMALNKPIVGMAATPDGGGYWLVASDGGVFAFGNAVYSGSVPGQGITSQGPIDGMVATPDGGGYWITGSDGSLYSYGDATFLGSLVGLHLSGPIVGSTAD